MFKQSNSVMVSMDKYKKIRDRIFKADHTINEIPKKHSIH